MQAASALVIDAASGQELYGKDPDQVRPIASTGKIFAAMVVRRRGIDLDAVTEITELDGDFARGGARTKLYVGGAFRNLDLLRALLIASDNRAPTALARAVGLSPSGLVAEMNRLAVELGCEQTRFTDPSGLHGNTSTARELTHAFQVAMQDPLLAEIMHTKSVVIASVGRRRYRIHYRNTNRSLLRGRHQVLAGKTGYTDEAGYCLLIAAELDGRPVIMVFLATYGRLTRFADFHRVAEWLRKRGHPGAVRGAANEAARASPAASAL